MWSITFSLTLLIQIVTSVDYHPKCPHTTPCNSALTLLVESFLHQTVETPSWPTTPNVAQASGGGAGATSERSLEHSHGLVNKKVATTLSWSCAVVSEWVTDSDLAYQKWVARQLWNQTQPQYRLTTMSYSICYIHTTLSCWYSVHARGTWSVQLTVSYSHIPVDCDLPIPPSNLVCS